jgi:hypothetical protein
MRVSSPIGDLPFEPRELRLRRGGLEVRGVMGAWPARVHIGPGDAPALLRLIAGPALWLTTVVAAVAAVTSVARTARTTSRRDPRGQ